MNPAPHKRFWGQEWIPACAGVTNEKGDHKGRPYGSLMGRCWDYEGTQAMAAISENSRHSLDQESPPLSLR